MSDNMVFTLRPFGHPPSSSGNHRWLLRYSSFDTLRVASNMVFTLRPAAHLPCLATRVGLGTITCSSGIVRFVQGGVEKTFHWWTLTLEHRKPSTEMTHEERIRDIMRHYPTLLKRWAGGTARVLELTTSHATLTIRIEHPLKDGNLQIAISPPLHFHGPFLWPDCEIDISLTDDLQFVVRDITSDAEILTESVLGVYENAKPHHRMVVQREQ